MATVTTEDVWIHDAADLDDYIRLDHAVAISHTPSARATRRRYAGGRTRSVTRVGVVSDLTVQAEFVTLEQEQWLESKAGRRLVLRDMRGRIVWGMIPDPSFAEMGGHLTYSTCSLKFTGLTGTAEVP